MNEVLQYFAGQDVFSVIRSNEQSAKASNRNLLTRLMDYAAYGVAVSQRFVPHATLVFGLERMIEGKYTQGTIELAVVPFLATLNHVFFPQGEEIANAKAVVEYLVGVDILRYVKATKQIQDKVEKRKIIDKIMDYSSYLGTFILRYGPTIAEIEGLRRLFMGQYKFGISLIAGGLYKNLWDYYRSRRRKRWLEFWEGVHELNLIDTVLDHIKRKKGKREN